MSLSRPCLSLQLTLTMKEEPGPSSTSTPTAEGRLAGACRVHKQQQEATHARTGEGQQSFPSPWRLRWNALFILYKCVTAAETVLRDLTQHVLGVTFASQGRTLRRCPSMCGCT